MSKRSKARRGEHSDSAAARIFPHLDEVLLVLVAVVQLLDLHHLAELRELDGAAAVYGGGQGGEGWAVSVRGTNKAFFATGGIRVLALRQGQAIAAARKGAYLRRPP